MLVYIWPNHTKSYQTFEQYYKAKLMWDLSDKAFTLTRSMVLLSNPWRRHQNGNVFRVTGPLCGEFTGYRWIPCKGQWHGALMFLLICTIIKCFANDLEAGDLRRHCAHYDVTVKRSTKYGYRNKQLTEGKLHYMEQDQWTGGGADKNYTCEGRLLCPHACAFH